jgi:hypothetical protein
MAAPATAGATNPLTSAWLSPTANMTIESAIRLLAGSLILLSLALYQFVSPWGLLLALFVGVNLAQSSLTGFCPAEAILKRLGLGGGWRVGREA